MDKRFGISVLPAFPPKTPAGRLELLLDMMSPTIVRDDDGNVVEVYDPILTQEEGLRLMDMPDLEKHEPPQRAPKTRHILYTGEYQEPDGFDALGEEIRFAAWALAHVTNMPVPVKSGLLRFVEAANKILERVPTSAKDTDG